MTCRSFHPKRTRCFVNMQQMALQLSLEICFQSMEISFIVNESDVRIGWELTNSFVNLRKFLIVTGFKLHAPVVLKLCNLWCEVNLCSPSVLVNWRLNIYSFFAYKHKIRYDACWKKPQRHSLFMANWKRLKRRRVADCRLCRLQTMQTVQTTRTVQTGNIFN